MHIEYYANMIERYSNALFKDETRLDSVEISTSEHTIHIKPAGLFSGLKFKETALSKLASRLTSYAIPCTLENENSTILPPALIIDITSPNAKKAMATLEQAVIAMENKPRNTSITGPATRENIIKRRGSEGPDDHREK